MEDKEYVVYYIQRRRDGNGSAQTCGPFPTNRIQLFNLRAGIGAWSATRTVLNRSGALPAVIGKNGTREWWVNGTQHHGGDLPARIAADGTLEWWVNGEKHRDSNRPAVMRADGTWELWSRHVNEGVYQVTAFHEHSLRRVFVAALLW